MRLRKLPSGRRDRPPPVHREGRALFTSIGAGASAELFARSAVMMAREDKRIRILRKPHHSTRDARQLLRVFDDAVVFAAEHLGAYTDAFGNAAG